MELNQRNYRGMIHDAFQLNTNCKLETKPTFEILFLKLWCLVDAAIFDVQCKKVEVVTFFWKYNSILGLPTSIAFIAFLSEVPRRRFKQKGGGSIKCLVLKFQTTQIMGFAFWKNYTLQLMIHDSRGLVSSPAPHLCHLRFSCFGSISLDLGFCPLFFCSILLLKIYEIS